MEESINNGNDFSKQGLARNQYLNSSLNRQELMPNWARKTKTNRNKCYEISHHSIYAKK